MGTTLLMAVALMLVIEGLFPFLAPSAWRETFRRILALSDGQIRFFGLTARRRRHRVEGTGEGGVWRTQELG